MREILFRGKCKDTGKWYKGQYIHLHRTTYCFKEDYERDKDNDIHQIVFEEMMDWGLPNRHLRVDVIPETVEQYTGLTDKNGTKIFEGDIINGYYSNGEKYIENSVVEWSNLFIAWNVNKHVSLFGRGYCYYEVIGNIHDNPELLKGE